MSTPYRHLPPGLREAYLKSYNDPDLLSFRRDIQCYENLQAEHEAGRIAICPAGLSHIKSHLAELRRLQQKYDELEYESEEELARQLDAIDDVWREVIDNLCSAPAKTSTTTDASQEARR